jgi:transcriptional regulator with GAF, ATPase, and Fis domain
MMAAKPMKTESINRVPRPISSLVGHGRIRSFRRERDGFNERMVTVLRVANKLKAAVLDLQYHDLPKVDFETGFYEQVEHFEISLILRALAQSGGSQVKAARLLKLNVTTLNSKIKRYQIKIPYDRVREPDGLCAAATMPSGGLG